MNADRRKVVLIGTGMVGMSFAYSLVNQGGICNELVLIDIDKKRANGEAMDLNHGLAFAKSNMKICAGEYKDCKDADIVVISAGVAQKEGETRLDLLQRNVEVFRSIIGPVIKSGFDGIFLVATNPVDIMTRVTFELSRFGASRVIGTGTSLDTARLRYLLGDYFTVDPKNIHGYVIGEHGDSEIAAWSSANVSGVPLNSFCEMRGHYNHEGNTESIEEQVKNSAYEIIAKKDATYYGIAMVVKRICQAIVRDEKSIFPISLRMHGEYALEDVVLSMPAIVGARGIETTIPISLDEKEVSRLHESAEMLRETRKEIR